MSQGFNKQSDQESHKNTATFLLTKQPRGNASPDDHRIKIVIVGSGHTGIAVAISILFKRLASELILIDKNENLAKAQAEDVGHVAGFLGNPKIVGTKDYSLARDATVCVITACAGADRIGDKKSSLLSENLKIFKSVVPNVCKFAPNSILVVVSHPVDILSYAAMKFSGFPSNRVIGLGTFLDSCRFQYFISRKLGVSASSVQALVVGENGPTSVPVWSTVSVMGIKLKDINKEIGGQTDPENWSDLHSKVVNSSSDITKRKGYCNWGIGICTSEIVDAIVRNTCVCITVSTFLQGCRHGFEKDVFMSLPCIVGRNGVQSYVRHLYTKEEQELILKSCKNIYEAQQPILEQLE